MIRPKSTADTTRALLSNLHQAQVYQHNEPQMQ